MVQPIRQHWQGEVERIAQRDAAQQLQDEQRQHPGRQHAIGVSVGEACNAHAQVKRVCRISRQNRAVGEQAHRRAPGEGAAVLAVVLRRGVELTHVSQHLQAGGRAATATVQRGLPEQPACEVGLPGEGRVFGLGVIPAEQGPANAGKHVALTLNHAGHHGADQALGGEERHLGLVSEAAETAVSWCVIAQARRPEAPVDLGQWVVRYGGTESVAHGAAEQTTETAGTFYRRVCGGAGLSNRRVWRLGQRGLVGEFAGAAMPRRQG